MKYIYNSPESQADKRYEYAWTILKTALERTQKKYGQYRMEPAAVMTEQRQFYELKNSTGKLTVMYLDSTPEHERDLIPIHIPVDKNLMGYRIFLIRKEDQPKFYSVKTVEDLKKFKFGQGTDWADVPKLRSNLFNVVTGSSYEGLFEMLINKRFDIFSRGANEIIDEYDRHKAQLPDLYIEESLILFYPAPMYFWFSKTENGNRLAERVREGMMNMVVDGTFDRLFMKYHGSSIAKLHLKDRKIFRIKNPFLAPETPTRDKRLWFDPQAH